MKVGSHVPRAGQPKEGLMCLQLFCYRTHMNLPDPGFIPLYDLVSPGCVHPKHTLLGATASQLKRVLWCSLIVHKLCRWWQATHPCLCKVGWILSFYGPVYVLQELTTFRDEKSVYRPTPWRYFPVLPLLMASADGQGKVSEQKTNSFLGGFSVLSVLPMYLVYFSVLRTTLMRP